MTLERRQFLNRATVAGAGLPREITVDQSNGRVYCHTASSPSGVGQALKSELDSAVSNLQSQISSLEEGHWAHLQFTRNINEWLDINDVPEFYDNWSPWPWTPYGNSKQALIDAGYRYAAFVSFNVLDNKPIPSNEWLKYKITPSLSEYNVLHDDILLGDRGIKCTYVGTTLVLTVPVFAKTQWFGPISFTISYTKEDYQNYETYDSAVSSVFTSFEGFATSWTKVTEQGELYWKTTLSPITVARATNGHVLEPTRLNVVTYALNKEYNSARFGGWYSGSGTNVLTATPTVFIKASSEDDQVPPMGFSCRVNCTFNVI
jgi:hypothetical protein